MRARLGRILLCERHAKRAEAGERTKHWEEVRLYLDLWQKVAEAREKETLARLLLRPGFEPGIAGPGAAAPESAARNGR